MLQLRINGMNILKNSNFLQYQIFYLPFFLPSFLVIPHLLPLFKLPYRSLTPLFIPISALLIIKSHKVMNLTPQMKWLQDLRLYEKKFQCIGAHPLQISQDQYTDCLALISSCLFYHFLLVIQEAERLDFSRTTKFLAKKYFDAYMAKNPEEEPQNLLKVMICCLKTAVKVNEAPQISEQYNLDFCMAQSNNQYSQQDMVLCEEEIFDILDFNFKITTPYDFLCLKSHLSALETEYQLNNIFELVECTIDICGSLWESIHFLAEEIFFGCLLYCLKIKKRSEWNSLIWQSTIRIIESKKICELIEEKIKDLSM